MRFRSRFLRVESEASMKDDDAISNDMSADPHRFSTYINLWKACAQRDLQRMKTLAEECGRDINCVNCKSFNGTLKFEKGLTPLHWLAGKGYTNEIQVLIDTGVLEVSKHGRKGDTALHCAARQGYVGTVRLLLECGAADGVDRNNKKGNTPLHVAAMNGFKECVVLLIDADSDVNAKNLIGDTPLHWAARRGDEDVMTCLLESGDVMFDSQNNSSETPLHCAIKRQSLECARLLLDIGANGNLEDSSGNIPVHLAMESNDMNLLELLYDQLFVDVNKRNQNGDRGLHIALKNGNYDMAKWLLGQARTDVNAIDASGDSVLHLAVKKDHYEIIQKLIAQCKADMSVEDSNGRLPIHLALFDGDSDIVKLFINQMNVDCIDERGKDEAARTPLHTSIWSTFLQYKEMKNGLKMTPLRFMIKQMPDVAELIFDRCVCEDRLSNLFLNYEVVDDTFAKWESEPYSKDFNVLKFNHPMKIIQKYNREALLDHPLLRMLLNRKWQIASIIYFSFLCFYAFFVSLLSGFMILSIPPYLANMTNITEDLCLQSKQSNLEIVFSYLLCVLASLGMLGELVQLILTKQKYLELHNLLDWTSYSSAVLILINFNSCGYRTDWQWQLGCFSVFISWMNLLFFLRRLPRLGIYVVMLTMILKTFFQFFIILFLFVLAFAITFYLLLQNQYPFQYTSYSIVKTWVMMIGEMEFVNIFHGYHKADVPEFQLPYETLTFAIFICFLIGISLIVMNLLVGLAVSDVDKLQSNSVYAMLGMKIDLSLDVELSMPAWLHSRIKAYQLDDYEQDQDNQCCTSGGCVCPVTCSWCASISKNILQVFQGSLYGPWIMRDANEIVKRRQRSQQQSDSMTPVYDAAHEIKQLKEHMDEIYVYLKRLVDDK